jgi:hypothetical protein
MESRIPKLDETVGAFGHYNAFTVINVDSVNKTVDLMAINTPSFTVHCVSFTALLYGEPKGKAAGS